MHIKKKSNICTLKKGPEVVIHHVMAAGWTLCMSSQNTCWTPKNPSPPVLLTCQHINLPYGSCSAWWGGTCRFHPVARAKHVATKGGSLPATTWCSLPWHPESCQDRCCYLRDSGWRLGKGDAEWRSRDRTCMWPGDVSNGRRAEFGSAPFAALARSPTW